MTVVRRPRAMKPAELRNAMVACRLTGARLAEILDVHPNTVSRWLQGHCRIPRTVAVLVRRMREERHTKIQAAIRAA